MTQDLNVIIVGGGRVGFQTTAILADRGHDITVVERDPDVCDAMADEYVATIIQGDATDPAILEQADVERADAIAGLTQNTGVNLAVCLEATEMNGDDLRTIARVDRLGGEEYTRFVDAVVFPERAGARMAANEIIGGDVESISDVTETLDIVQVRVAEGAPAAGKRLANVNFPTGTLVVSDDDGERIAGPDTTLDPGKRYVVAVEPDVADEVMNLLRG
ncbi:potassium channel family protein [Halorientalis regularis]|jgi:trk system potassium uptake protein TrkA|uniref:Trk system potassium uptake protein TrkA n=1 Tax=Halorientalis regularis TaxID=660518 RepID=A0A1G7LT56_9EURY|nr:TrkA family potassium uptake protein [Halorientalis regularis]SDF52623.1 trk system potassium uptake protein TrkA [Halorientalis regularis]